jgi:hypothetical protein
MGEPLTSGVSTPSEQPNQDFSRSDPQTLQAYENQPPYLQAEQSGIACGHSIEPVPMLARAPCDVGIESSRNSAVICTVDRKGGLTDGYGGRGATQCGAVDIVAGRMGPYVAARDKEGKPIKVNPNFRVDAARVYVSQKSDIDEYFGLVDGKVGNPIAASAVGIKADEVRIVARGGIKLVTGTDVRNSRDYVVVGTGGIDLIAGNEEDAQQPLVKGDSLVYALAGEGIGADWKAGDNAGLIGEIEKLREIVYSFLMYQRDFNCAMVTHTHRTKFFGLLSLPPIMASPITVKSITQQVAQTELSIIAHQTSLSTWGASTVSPVMSDTYINSAYNTTN